MEKISTEDCKTYLVAYYRNQSIDTEKENWDLIKKYKNHNGYRCRDFFNKLINKEVIVVDKMALDLEIIEDKNYTYFIEELAKNPVFYYVPLVTNNKIVFYFEPVKIFNSTGLASKDTQIHKPYLINELNKIFKDVKVATLGVEMLVVFTGLDVDNVIRKLEMNRASYNSQLYKLVNKNIYNLYVPDLTLSVYDFKEYENIQEEQVINKILKICSSNNELLEKDYALLKFLFKKVSKDEMKAVENISLGFKKELDLVLLNIIEEENKRKQLYIY